VLPLPPVLVALLERRPLAWFAARQAASRSRNARAITLITSPAMAISLVLSSSSSSRFSGVVDVSYTVMDCAYCGEARVAREKEERHAGHTVIITEKYG